MLRLLRPENLVSALRLSSWALSAQFDVLGRMPEGLPAWPQFPQCQKSTVFMSF